MLESSENGSPFSIPFNKFYPPHIDQSQSLLRTSLLTTKLPQTIKAKKAVIVEAQAGQGKTTLISQFLAYNNYDYIWYQVGPEDADPVQLLASLLADFSLRFSDFQSPQLTTILRDGEIGPLDLKRCANLLLGDIDGYLAQDLYVVFDDLHLITGAALTTSLLEYLLDMSPPRLHFVLSTRLPLDMKCKTLRDASRISYLQTSDLALSRHEIEELFSSVFDKNITPQDAVDIHRLTNGWIMGIVLASHPISGRSRFWQLPQGGSSAMPPVGQGHMLDYFQDEIFDKIPESLHVPFFKLSFISEIPVDLASTITGIDVFGGILSDLARENFFVYRLNDRHSVFRLHHFFQEFLQLQAKKCLDEREISAIFTREAEYYLERDLVEKALSSYRHGGNYRAMETILKARGMELVAKNRTLTILTLLDSIPRETLYEYSWLTFYAGFLRNDYAPHVTLPYYEKAKELFVLQNDSTGELLCLSQMIYFHFVISGQYKTGSALLPKAAELLTKNESSLPDAVKIVAARNLASGYCFFNSEMDKAQSYISIANTLAGRQNSRNFIASTRFIQGYIDLLSGNLPKFLREAEACYSLMNDPLVGMSNKLTIRILYLCYLSMAGDFLNFRGHQLAIQESIDQTVVDQTIAAPYFYVWGASCLFSMGQIAQGVELLEKGFGITSTASTDHMHSQLLQWLAYGTALQGDSDKALSLIAKSTTLREQVGGPFYEAVQATLAGGIFSRSKEFSSAHKVLNRALQLADSIPSTFLKICALMQRSYCNLMESGAESSLDDLDTALSLMKNSGYTHFWGWEPTMMGILLSTAVRFDIEKSFAQMLARLRLDKNFTDDGEPVTLLHFSLLDNFQLRLGDEVICRAKDLTPSQRELLGLLMTAKGQRISQEKVQLELWPDNSPENARKSFDTLLTRLRKELSKTENLQIRDYIFMQKGILCLTNYQMDSLQFSEAARHGLVLCKNSDWWQAGNAFNQALSYWKGSLPEDTFKSEQVLNYNDQLVNTLIEFTTIWATHMAETGRGPEAISLIEKVLRMNTLEEQLVTLLYALHINNNCPIKAKETLERYRLALIKVDYSPEEIEKFLQDVMDDGRAMVFGRSGSTVL